MGKIIGYIPKCGTSEADSRCDNKRICGSDRRTKLHCSWANRGRLQSLSIKRERVPTRSIRLLVGWGHTSLRWLEREKFPLNPPPFRKRQYCRPSSRLYVVPCYLPWSISKVCELYILLNNATEARSRASACSDRYATALLSENIEECHTPCTHSSICSSCSTIALCREPHVTRTDFKPTGCIARLARKMSFSLALAGWVLHTHRDTRSGIDIAHFTSRWRDKLSLRNDDGKTHHKGNDENLSFSNLGLPVFASAFLFVPPTW